MKHGSGRLRGLVVFACACAMMGAGAGRARAGSPYEWTPTGAGAYNWNNAGSEDNWGQGTAAFPNAADDAAVVTADLAGEQTINLNQVVTVGTLTLGDSGDPRYSVHVAPAGGTLYMDVSSGSASIATPAGDSSTNRISAVIRLFDPLSLDLANGTGSLWLSGVIQENAAGMGIVKNGVGTAILSAANTFTGVLTLNAGTVQATTSAGALGTGAASLLLNGGVLELANNTALSFARGLRVAGDSAITTDRLTAGAGITHTLGVTTSQTATLTVAAGTNQTSGTAGLTLGVTHLAGNPTFRVLTNGTGAATLLLLGAVHDGGLARTVTKTGPGTLRLGTAAASLVNGTLFRVGEGALEGNIATALGALAAVDIDDGAVFGVNAAMTIGALSNTNAATHTGRVQLGAILTVGGTNDLSSTFSGELAGAGGLTKARTGTLTLTGTNNSYNGVTTVSLGLLKAGAVNVLPSGTGKGNLTLTTANTCFFDLAGYDQTVNGVTGAGMVTNTAGTARFTVGAGNATASGAVVMGDGGGSVLGLKKIGAGTITLSGALRFSGDVLVEEGTLVLSAANTYTGETAIAGGTLRYGAANPLFNGSVIITSNGTLDIVSFSDTIGLVTLSNGTITGTSGVLTGSRYDAEAGVVGATLGGTGDLAKTTSGLLTLSGAGVYSGGTVIHDGTVRVANVSGSATGSGAVTVKGDATLEGNGTMSGAVTLEEDALVSPGLPDAPGVMAAGELNWTAGAVYHCTVTNVTRGKAGAGLDYDLLSLTGPLNIVPVEGKKPVIRLDSLGQTLAFDPNQNYALRLASAGGGAPAGDAFELATNDFLAAGTWVLTNANDNLFLLYLGDPELDPGLYTHFTWANGSGGDWSTGWQENPFYPSAPGDVAVITQALAGHATITLDVADAVVGSLTLGDPAYGYTLTGANTLTLAGSGPAASPEILVTAGTQTVATALAMNAVVQVNVTAASGARARLTGIISGGPATNDVVAVYATGGVELAGTNTYPGMTRLHNAVGSVLYTALDSMKKVWLPTAAAGSSTLNKLVLVGGGTWTPMYTFGNTSFSVNDLCYNAQPFKPPSISAMGAPMTITLGAGGSMLWQNNGSHSPNMSSGGWWPWGCTEWNTKIVLTDRFNISGASRSMHIYNNPDSDDDFLEMRGQLTGTATVHPAFVLSQGGTLELNAGNNALPFRIRLDDGTVRVNSCIGVTTNGNWLQLNGATARLSGHGQLFQVSGFGSIEPGKDGTSLLTEGENTGMLTSGKISPVAGATPAASTRFAFEFATQAPDFGDPTNSLNDVLRLTNAAPFDVSLAANNTVGVYFRTESPGGPYRGGFYAVQLDAAPLLAAVENAGFVYYRQDPAGAVVYNGVAYSELDLLQQPVRVEAVAVDGGGAITCFYVARSRGTLIILR